MFRLSHFIILLSLFSSSALAHFSIDKSRLYFDKKNRFQTVTIRNTSEAPLSYTIKVNHVEMSEEGRITPVADENNVPQSAKKLLRYSPRRGTILPGGSQIVRFTIRKPAGLENGEYRSQLRIEGGLVGEAHVLSARLAYNMPIIVRHGKTEASADLELLGLERNDKGQPMLALLIKREGTRSLFGSFTITNAKGEVIGQTKGVSVYEPLNKRKISIELTGEITPRVNVVYEELKEYGGTAKVQKSYSLR